MLITFYIKSVGAIIKDRIEGHKLPVVVTGLVNIFCVDIGTVCVCCIVEDVLLDSTGDVTSVVGAVVRSTAECVTVTTSAAVLVTSVGAVVVSSFGVVVSTGVVVIVCGSRVVNTVLSIAEGVVDSVVEPVVPCVATIFKVTTSADEVVSLVIGAVVCSDCVLSVVLTPGVVLSVSIEGTVIYIDTVGMEVKSYLLTFLEICNCISKHISKFIQKGFISIGLIDYLLLDNS